MGRADCRSSPVARYLTRALAAGRGRLLRLSRRWGWPMAWKRLASRAVFTHPRFDVYEDEVELPNGYRTSYLRLQQAGNAVSLLCRREDGRILLQRQYSYPPNQVMLELPGGNIPPDEDPEIGANRELMEEAGLRAGCLTPLGAYFINNRRSDRKMLVYLAEELTAASLPGDPEEEEIETAWFTEAEIEALIREDQIVNPGILAAWSLYRAKMSAGPPAPGTEAGPAT